MNCDDASGHNYAGDHPHAHYNDKAGDEDDGGNQPLHQYNDDDTDDNSDDADPA